MIEKDSQNSLQEVLNHIKKEFFTFRNGIIAEAVRKMYDNSTMVYGLTVPQFIEIAAGQPKDYKIAMALWNDITCRESRMLSLYLLPPSQLTIKEAEKMVKSVRSIEEADFLAFKVLRNLPYAKELMERLQSDEEQPEITAYAIKMLEKNIKARY